MQICFAIALCAPVIAAFPAAAADFDPAPYPYIIDDGDTITIWATGEVIRLLGFDTPEISYVKCESERRLGLAAKSRTDRGTSMTLPRYARTAVMTAS